jgi:hypothetical protein
MFARQAAKFVFARFFVARQSARRVLAIWPSVPAARTQYYYYARPVLFQDVLHGLILTVLHRMRTRPFLKLLHLYPSVGYEATRGGPSVYC